MGFSLKRFIEELEQQINRLPKNSEIVAELKEFIAEQKEYAKQCGQLK